MFRITFLAVAAFIAYKLKNALQPDDDQTILDKRVNKTKADIARIKKELE